jgi:hypothetical protein
MSIYRANVLSLNGMAVPNDFCKIFWNLAKLACAVPPNSMRIPTLQ